MTLTAATSTPTTSKAKRKTVSRRMAKTTAISRLGTTAATPAAAKAKITAATTVLAGLEADLSLICFGSKGCIGGRAVGARRSLRLFLTFP